MTFENGHILRQFDESLETIIDPDPSDYVI